MMDDKIKEIGLEYLLLDRENPRLPESVDRDQQSMLDYIAETTSIEELMEAIAQNDYFSGEPLIVIPAGNKKEYIVVEGNRRLTALRLLQNPNEYSHPGKGIKTIAQEAKYKPTQIPVVVRPSRAEVLPYLGYRHITGVKQWEPLAKARYIEQLFNYTKASLAPKDRYGEVAKTIGSRRDHIKRNLDALAVYKEIEQNEFYGIEGLDDESIKFAILSTALADDRIGSFVGISEKDENGDFEALDPIVDSSNLNTKSIEELTRWLYEKDGKGKTKLGESRNLRYLGAVVDNTRALNAFRNNSPLKVAYQLTSDITTDFVELLYSAEGMLTEAASMVATVQYDADAYQTARRILEHIKLIGSALKQKNRPDEDEF